MQVRQTVEHWPAVRKTETVVKRVLGFTGEVAPRRVWGYPWTLYCPVHAAACEEASRPGKEGGGGTRGAGGGRE